mmetsp:Transcript_65689/g.174049  ORF Transcript_65689/g.174049 Transcript_65689/m.174049 type:complete len:201 (+) Transcript_65689:120-722(+)
METHWGLRAHLRAYSQVHALWDISFFLVQRFFLGLSHVRLRHLHAPFSKSQHTRFGTNGFDVGATELVFRCNEFFQVHVIGQSHLAGMDLKDAAFGLLVWHWKFNFSIDPSRSDHCRIQTVDPVCRHDDLDVSSVVESVKLIQQLEHRSLNFFFASTGCIITLGRHGVDLIDEDDCWCVLSSSAEHFPHKLGTISQILLN